MKFTVSTKPLSDALNLGVINQNVSKFYRKSCLAQLCADKHSLTINLEAAFILSEIRLKGSGDSEESARIFVDCLLLKQLVSTFDTAVTTLEFTDTGLILHSGKSKFTLPKLVDDDDIELNAPHVPDTSTSISIDKADWKFIKDFQMYAIAMSFIHPVYTKVWVGSSGDVLVGDFDNSLFTHSAKNKLGTTCLLSDTIINLFNSLPEGAVLKESGKDYVIHIKTDSFELLSQFTPQYEADEDVGSYNSEIILDMMKHPATGVAKVTTAALTKFLGQAELLSNSSEDTITLKVSESNLSLSDRNIDCMIDFESGVTIATPYQVEFKTSLLKSVLSNYDDEKITIAPMITDSEPVGIIVWGKELTTVLAGVEE